MAANLKDVLENATHAPGGVRGMGSAVEAVGKAGARLVVLEGGAELGAGSVGIVAAIGEILLDFGLWAILLALVGIIISMKETEWVFIKVCDAIPFTLGSGPKRLVISVFRPVDQLEGWVADRMGQVAVNIAVNWIHGFQQFMEYQFGVHLGKPGATSGTQTNVPGTGTTTVPGTGGLATTSQVDRVQREINDIYRRLSAQDNRIAKIEENTGVVLLPAPGVVSLQNRVAHLESVVNPLVHDVNTDHGRIVKINHDLNVVQDELKGLRNNLNKVRAVQFGVQDVLDTVQLQINAVQYQVNQLEPQVDANARTLHILHPLQGLLYLGAVGIRNLQKLEKNPCQCPQIPGFPGDDAAFLALYEYLTNG